MAQVAKSLKDLLTAGNKFGVIDDKCQGMMLETDICYQTLAEGRHYKDGAEITLSGRLFQMEGPATGKARPPRVDSLTDGISSRLVPAERNRQSQYQYIANQQLPLSLAGR